MAEPVTRYHERYRKVRFYSTQHGATAGLVFTMDKLSNMGVGELSRYWPYSESLKMQRIQHSPVFETWEQAFNYRFE